MIKLWIITEQRTRRDRHGYPYQRRLTCVQRGELALVGQTLHHGPRSATVTPKAARALAALMLRAPNRPPLTVGELLDYLYEEPGLEPDGNAAGVFLAHARAALRAVGGPAIENRHGVGWRLAT